MIAEELKSPITKEQLKGFAFIKIDGYDITPNLTIFRHYIYETGKIKNNRLTSKNTSVFTGVNAVKPDIIQAPVTSDVADALREINSCIAERNTRKSRYFVIGVRDETLKAHRRTAPKRK